jgi:hypothetical protein
MLEDTEGTISNGQSAVNSGKSLDSDRERKTST